MLSTSNTSSPKRQDQTEALKVKIDGNSSFSFNHSISGSPSNDSYNNNIPLSYPNTPIISNHLSYTNTPIHDKLNPNEHPPITPITPDIFQNNTNAQSPSSKHCITPHHINNENNNSNSSQQFPDTTAVNNANKIELSEIDEKKQLAQAQTQTQTKKPAPTRPCPKSNKTESKRKRSNKFSLIEKVEDTTHSTEKSQQNTLAKHGYEKMKYIADTLQGCTYIARKLSNNSEVVIKSTKKDLYTRGITISKEGKAFNIREDIVAEGKMMKYFMSNNPPSSLITYMDFFEDHKRYYLVMENGGVDFFDFVVKCHELINAKKLSMKEWRKQCKFMFAQIIQCIKWLHSQMNYCHLDVSLENILISREAYFDEKTGKLHKCYVKFIDFGLAEYFDTSINPFFLCKKYVGKTHYKSPKVYAKKEEFMANKADIWSLGVCLFMMIIGAPPYNKPNKNDPGFRFICENKITKLLYSWNRIKYVTPNLYDLMEKMLNCDEEKRISIDEIVRHDWLKIYFPNEQNQPISPMSPLSPSLSSKTSNSTSFSQINNGGKSLNIMMPQQAVSMSRSYNKANNNNPSTPQPRKASASYQYYSKYSNHKSPHNRKYTNSSTNGTPTVTSTSTPTPIVESHTQINSDSQSYYAAVDSVKDNKKNKEKNEKKKKKNKKFFKLSLNIFGSSKIK